MSPNRGSGSADQRRHYRVSTALEGMLVATLVLPDGRTIPGELVDLSAGGACLQWSVKTTPVLDVNDTVQLNFQVKGKAVPLQRQAAVRWMGSDAGFVRYGFEFFDSEAFDAAADAILWGLFNRRRTRRD